MSENFCMDSPLYFFQPGEPAMNAIILSTFSHFNSFTRSYWSHGKLLAPSWTIPCIPSPYLLGWCIDGDLWSWETLAMSCRPRIWRLVNSMMMMMMMTTTTTMTMMITTLLRFTYFWNRHKYSSCEIFHNVSWFLNMLIKLAISIIPLSRVCLVVILQKWCHYDRPFLLLVHWSLFHSLYCWLYIPHTLNLFNQLSAYILIYNTSTYMRLIFTWLHCFSVKPCPAYS